MASTIDQNYVNQFSDMLYDLVEQKESKLMKILPREEGRRGEFHFFDTLGTVSAASRTDRFAEDSLQDIAHGRRAAVLADYQVKIGLSDLDKLRMVIDPQAGYLRKAASGLARQFDIDALTAMVGSALGGKSGTTSTALPSTQKNTTASGLTVARLIAAKKQFVKNNVSGVLYCAIEGEALQDLLSETEIKSVDYNTVKALVAGEVDTFMGFKFLQFGNGIIPEVTAGSVTRAILFAEDAVKVAMAKNIEVRVDEIADRGHMILVSGYASWGMVRMEEEKVFSIQVTY